MGKQKSAENDISQSDGERDQRHIVKMKRDLFCFGLAGERYEMLGIIKADNAITFKNLREEVGRVSRSAAQVQNQASFANTRLSEEDSGRFCKELGEKLESLCSNVAVSKKILHGECSLGRVAANG